MNCIKFRRRFRFLALAVLLITVLVMCLQHTYTISDPKYQGKHLSQWVKDLDPHKHSWLESERAREAIREIGTNAIPFLMRELQRESPFEPPFAKPIIGVTTERRARAAQGLIALGTLAREALPELSKIVENGDYQCAYWALMVIHKIQPNGSDYLQRALTNKNFEIRQVTTNLFN